MHLFYDNHQQNGGAYLCGEMQSSCAIQVNNLECLAVGLMLGPTLHVHAGRDGLPQGDFSIITQHSKV